MIRRWRWRSILGLLTILCTVLPVVAGENAAAAQQDLQAIITTKFGDIVIRFFPDTAPKHVENFLKLARSGFYDGTIFHRVVPGFVIQGGDPTTKGADTSKYGTGGPGYQLEAEFNDRPHLRGTVSMARSRHPDSAGSQFFIVVSEARSLDGKYTVFGEVVSGMEVVDTIVSQPRDQRDMPRERVEMTVRLVEPSAS